MPDSESRLGTEALVNTTQLECFVQVAGNLSFRRAAEELHLSQPTVSKQVAGLESELGGPLFVRTTRSVMLTALGESFLPDAQEILRLVYSAAGRARRRLEEAEVALGYSDPNELHNLSSAFDELRRAQEGFRVSLIQGSRDANIERLSHEQLDLVVGFETASLETGGIRFERLTRDGLVCVVREDSPLAGLERVGEEDVAGLSQIVCLPMSLRRRGYSAQSSIPRTDEGHTVWCSTTSEALCLVDAGFGYALLPTLSTLPAPGRLALPWERTTRASYGIYLREGRQPDAVRRFLKAAKDRFGAGWEKVPGK